MSALQFIHSEKKRITKVYERSAKDVEHWILYFDSMCLLKKLYFSYLNQKFIKKVLPSDYWKLND